MAKIKLRKAPPDDPIFTIGPQAFTPASRPTGDEKPLSEKERALQALAALPGVRLCEDGVWRTDGEPDDAPPAYPEYDEEDEQRD